jgi:ABC-type dipeptide/oligopeptide/nickel transport system permease subunit
MTETPAREPHPPTPKSPRGRRSGGRSESAPEVTRSLEVAPPPPETPAELEQLQREGLEVEARSQWQLSRRRFFRHKLAMGSLAVLLLIFAAGIFAPALTNYKPLELSLDDIGIGPTLHNRHFFGTDQLGRDYFTRVLYGIRTTARVAFLVAFLSTAIGTVIGALAGYYGGWIDSALMRFTDLILTLPALALLLTASALLGEGSQYRVAVILALLYWTYLARVVRGSFLSLKEKEFVEAARAVGASDARIIVRHLLPNSLGPIIVNGTLTLATAILVEAFLSFLGFGIRPPTPALGLLISEGQGAMLDMWWLVTFPGLTIVLICLCVNFIGDGLRDALDPTQSRIRA